MTVGIRQTADCVRGLFPENCTVGRQALRSAAAGLPPKPILGIGRAEIVVGETVGDDVRVLVILDESGLVEGRPFQVLTRLRPAIILDVQRHIPLAIEILNRLAVVGRTLAIVELEDVNRTSPAVDISVRLLAGLGRKPGFAALARDGQSSIRPTPESRPWRPGSEPGSSPEPQSASILKAGIKRPFRPPIRTSMLPSLAPSGYRTSLPAPGPSSHLRYTAKGWCRTLSSIVVRSVTSAANPLALDKRGAVRGNLPKPLTPRFQQVAHPLQQLAIVIVDVARRRRWRLG